MIISHSKKFIFLKTRKTAGTSIENFLVPYLDRETDICTGSERAGVPLINHPKVVTGHGAWFDIIHHKLITEKQWADYYKFALERNPFEKVVSDYKFKKGTDQFKGTWSEYLTQWVNSGRMSDWKRYTHNNNPVCNVGRFEHLNEFMEGVCAQIKVPFTEWQTAPHLYADPGNNEKHYSAWYENQDQINIVADNFEKEFVYFGYSFDPREATWMKEEFEKLMDQCSG